MNNNIQLKEFTKVKTGDYVVPLKDACIHEGGYSESFPIGYDVLDNAMKVKGEEAGGIRSGDLAVITGLSGAGKCHGKGTKILMFDGSIKNVEDIKIGDNLMGDDSTLRKVLKLGRGKEMMYRVSHKKNRTESYVVNESHILSLKNNSNAYGDKGVKDISVRELLKQSSNFRSVHVGYKVGVEFREKKVNIDPYFIGLWLGDGTSESTGITTMDKEIVNYLEKLAKRMNLGITITNQGHNKSKIYSLTREKKFESIHKTHGGKYVYKNKQTKNGGYGNIKALKTCLRELDLINNKHIPEIYKINSRKNRLKLLAGLIDSDGYKDNNNYEIVQKSKKLADDIVYLCRSLGVWSYWTIKHDKQFNKDYYRIHIYGKLKDVPVLLKRKKCSERKQIKNALHYGIKVKKNSFNNYYGFELNGNGRYLLGDFTVTHNTTFSENIVMNLDGIAIPTVFFSYEVLIDNLYAKFVDMNISDQALIYTPKKNISGSVKWIEEKIKEAQEKYYAKVIFIDHIDFLSPANLNSSDQRRIVIRDICQGLKTLAIDLEVSIFLLAHVRKVQGREVEMQDLAESSALFQIPDYVFSVARHYRVETSGGREMKVAMNEGIVKVLKNRLTGEQPFMNFVLENNIIRPLNEPT